MPVGTWGTIHTKQAGKGKWSARVRFRDTDGHTREVMRTGPTKGAAKNALTEALTARVSPNGGTIRPDSTVREVIDHWYVGKRDDWSPATRRRYREVIDRHIVPGIGALRVREATVGALEVYLRGLADKVGAPTSKTARSVLSGALAVAVRHGALGANPIRDVQHVKIDRKIPQALAVEHIAKFRAALLAREEPTGGSGRPVHPGLAALVDVMLGTGARIGEALALRWCDVDLDAGTVTIAGTVTMDDDGKWIRKGTLKTDGSYRRLHLPTFAVEALRAHRDKLPPTVDDLVFPSAAGTVRDPGNARKAWRKVATECGLPAGSTPHSLRRTVATVIDRTAGTKSAASQLGHTQESTTMRHYVERAAEGPDVAAILETLAS